MKNAESIMVAFFNCCLVEKTTSLPKLYNKKLFYLYSIPINSKYITEALLFKTIVFYSIQNYRLGKKSKSVFPSNAQVFIT